MRIWEKSFAILNLIFIFVHIFTFEVTGEVPWYVFGYISVFLWMMVLNYFFEGFKM